MAAVTDEDIRNVLLSFLRTRLRPGLSPELIPQIQDRATEFITYLLSHDSDVRMPAEGIQNMNGLINFLQSAAATASPVIRDRTGDFIEYINCFFLPDDEDETESSVDMDIDSDDDDDDDEEETDETVEFYEASHAEKVPDQFIRLKW